MSTAVELILASIVFLLVTVFTGEILRWAERRDDLRAEKRRIMHLGLVFMAVLVVGCAGQSAERHRESGKAALAKGDIKAAHVEFAAAVKADPASAVHHYNLANVLARRGLYDQAIIETKEALRLDPGYAKASQLLTWISSRIEERSDFS